MDGESIRTGRAVINFIRDMLKSKFTMEHERNKYLETQNRSQGKKELDLGVR